MRGGSFWGSYRYCRSAARRVDIPVFTNIDRGLRLVASKISSIIPDNHYKKHTVKAGRGQKKNRKVENHPEHEEERCHKTEKESRQLEEERRNNTSMRQIYMLTGYGDPRIEKEQQTSDMEMPQSNIETTHQETTQQVIIENINIETIENRLVIKLPDMPKDAVALEMVYIQPGSFMMGSKKGFLGIGGEKRRNDDEGPLHKVTLTKGFFIGKYPVTQIQWIAVMRYNPSYNTGSEGRLAPKTDLPVEQVTWYDCQEFVKKLNQSQNEYIFRLPTEAEWEYACRAETQTRFYWGNDPSEREIDQYAWYIRNSGHLTHPVGLKKPNAWDLYDMNGNLNEWCKDWYSDYSQYEQIDPKGPESGSCRVQRGGSNTGYVFGCRSAWRNKQSPKDSTFRLGFRLVASPIT